jgi:hypothetical protein
MIARHDHAVECGHFFVEVGDDRESDLFAELFLDVPGPGDVRVDAVDAQAQELDVHLAELGVDLGESQELRRANRREIGRVGEKDEPAPLEVLQLEDALGRDGLEWRRRRADSRQARRGLSCGCVIHLLYPSKIEFLRS